MAGRSIGALAGAILAGVLLGGCGGKNPPPGGEVTPGSRAGSETAGSGTATNGSGGVTNVGNGDTNR